MKFGVRITKAQPAITAVLGCRPRQYSHRLDTVQNSETDTSGLPEDEIYGEGAGVQFVGTLSYHGHLRTFVRSRLELFSIDRTIDSWPSSVCSSLQAVYYSPTP